MKTTHRILFSDACRMRRVAADSIDLVVTSPPYPLIEMWDPMFFAQSRAAAAAFRKGNGGEAFERMHQLLDPAWAEVYRVLKSGGFACINIGDAVRTVNGNFALYPNHVRILQKLLSLGFAVLPDILWRKQTNAPNKFMGSGMLPAGAYVTLEHEYILIVRKGPKREFDTEAEKQNRRQSALFWEERNVFYSDIWLDIKGTGQRLNDRGARLRSAAFPFEVAYRLINMYSVKGDTVLDPFLGTGTTVLAAVASARNSIGVEIDASFSETIQAQMKALLPYANHYMHERLQRHVAFVIRRLKEKGPLKHRNRFYGFPVVTAQERELRLNELSSVDRIDNDEFEIHYEDAPQKAFCRNWRTELEGIESVAASEEIPCLHEETGSKQMQLF